MVDTIEAVNVHRKDQNMVSQASPSPEAIGETDSRIERPSQKAKDAVDLRNARFSTMAEFKSLLTDKEYNTFLMSFAQNIAIESERQNRRHIEEMRRLDNENRI